MTLSEAAAKAKQVSLEYLSASDVLTTAARVEQQIKEREAHLKQLVAEQHQVKAAIDQAKNASEQLLDDTKHKVQHLLKEAADTAKQMTAKAEGAVHTLTTEAQGWEERAAGAKAHHEQFVRDHEHERAALQAEVDELRLERQRILARFHG